MHRERVALSLLAAASLALVLVPAPGLADGNAPEAKGELTMRQQSEQGIHYYRKRMLAPAMAALEKAQQLPGGNKDYRTLSNLARVYYDLVLLEKAIPTARAARDAAVEPEEKAEAARYVESLEERFGGVTFRKAREQVGDITRGIIHLEDRGGLIDPVKKQVFEKIAARFRDTQVELPITLYLPFGSFAANRAPFEVQKGNVADVELILYNLEEGVSPWWYVAGGAVVVAGATVAALLLLGGEEPEDTQALRVGDLRLRMNPLAGVGEAGR